MADALVVELHGLEEEATDDASEATDIGAVRSVVRARCRVTSTTGSGSGLRLSVETSPDGSTGWRTVWSSGFLKAGALLDLTVDRLERFVRVSWTLSGITAAAFAVTAEFHTLYATRRDLHLTQLDEGVTSETDNEIVAEELLSATADAEDALNANYPLPISTWPSSLTLRVAAIAKYRIFNRIGFAPQGADELIVKESDDAQAWLRRVGKREIQPPGLTPRPTEENRVTSGNPANPTEIPSRFSDNWGDFG